MKNSVLWVSIASFLGVTLAFSFFADESAAMPAFARKYDAPCSSCHVAFPKLNEFGIEFKQRGYRMEDEGVGQSVWKLPGIPIGGVGHAGFMAMNMDPADPNRSFEARSMELEFFFGGVLAPNVSFFGDFGANIDAGEPLTPDLAFIIFDDIISDSKLNLKLGAFDADFPYLSDARSLTHSGYLVRIAADGEEGVSLGKRGAEINGYFKETKTRYAVGVGNDSVTGGLNGTNEKNSVRAVHAWVTQSAELLGYNQTLGFFYSSDRNDDPTLPDGGPVDSTQAGGITLDLHYGLTGLLLGYFQYDGSKFELNSEIDSGLVELLHSFSPSLVGVARFDYQEYDDDMKMHGTKLQYTASLHYLFNPNVQLVGEFVQVNDEPPPGQEMDLRMGSLLVHFGF